MSHEKIIAILLWGFFAWIFGSIVVNCSRCELNGGVYIRGMANSHCIDPSTGKAKP